MPLIHCLYASRATHLFAEPDLPALLEKARGENLLRAVTGILLYIDGIFFQVLEGESSLVDATFDRIARDGRHQRVSRLLRAPIYERDFADWSMGFARLSAEEADGHLNEPGFFAAPTCLEELNASRARRLLNAFRDGRWRTESTGLHRRLTRRA